MQVRSAPSCSLPTLKLPSPFRVVSLREAGDAFAHAKLIASEQGAATLVHVGRFDLMELAVVLEPEEPLTTARRVVYAGLIALREALLIHLPPQRLITFAWPDAIRVDGVPIGGARLAWPVAADEGNVPDWLVFGAMSRIRADDETGFGIADPNQLVEDCVRHFMAILDAWQADGFSIVAKSYLAHLAEEAGTPSTIDDNGDLLVERPDRQKSARRSLTKALAEPTWLDATTGEPYA
jgi:Biotin/lipoate A/B protein ligase family